MSPVSGVSEFMGSLNGSKIYLLQTSFRIYFRQSKREFWLSLDSVCKTEWMEPALKRPHTFVFVRKKKWIRNPNIIIPEHESLKFYEQIIY